MVLRFGHRLFSREESSGSGETAKSSYISSKAFPQQDILKGCCILEM